MLNRKSISIEPIHGNEYETPQELFNKLNDEFNFIHDVACNKSNIKCGTGFTYPEYDSLKCDWPLDGWLWLNPPYKPLRPWIEKTQEQVKRGCKVVMLIPPVTIACKYFSNLKPKEMRFLKGRVKFLIEGEPMHSNTRDSVIYIYDGDPEFSIARWIEK